MELLRALRRRLSGAGKTATLALRAAAALALAAAFVRVNGGYILPLSLVCLALCFGLIALCSFRMNAFGVMFGVLLEYYSFAGSFETWVVPAGLGLFAVFLFFASLGPAPFGVPGPRQEESRRPEDPPQ